MLGKLTVITVRKPEKKEFAMIARLHKNAISTGFLSTLGCTFLNHLYQAISREGNAIVLVAEIDGQVAGFVSGTLITGELFKNVLLKNWFRFLLPVVTIVFNVNVIVKMIETIKYGLKNHKSGEIEQVPAELLSIAVAESCQGKGVGKTLIENLEKFFLEKQAFKYKVVTYSENIPANYLYRNCKMILKNQFTHHGNIMNEYTKLLYEKE